jgi:transcriptional regulator NrdR family protein
MNNSELVNSVEPRFVIKRSGDKVPFEEEKIINAVAKAMMSVGKVDHVLLRKVFLETTKFMSHMLMKFMTWWRIS